MKRLLLLATVLLPVVATAQEVRNLGLAARSGVVAGSRMFAFQVDEFRNGGGDLNGNGRGADVVVHVFDTTSGETINLAVAGVNLRADGEVLAFDAVEQSQDEDLNGDGDMFDLVPHVFDRRDGSLVNLGRGSGGEFVLSRRLVGFIENGFAGPVLVYDLRDRVLREIGFAGARFLKALGPYLLFSVDQEVHVYNVARHRTLATGLRAEHVFDVQRVGRRLAIPVSEGFSAVDLNGDGDSLDQVVQLLDVATAETINTGVALADGTGTPPLRKVGRAFLLVVSEHHDGDLDLNGDGDTADAVLHRLATDGSLANFGLAVLGVLDSSGSQGAVLAPEWSQGSTDLNGDGDALDLMAYVYDASLDLLFNTGLATAGALPVAWRRGIAFGVSEWDQGRVDLNGDGDDGDVVPHLVSLGRWGAPPNHLEISNTRLAMGFWGYYVHRSGRFVVVSVSEAGQGATDLDGDGQLHGQVAHSFRVARPLARNWHLDTIRQKVGAGRFVAVLVPENFVDDLNGDGDALDEVLHIGPLWPRRTRRGERGR